MEGIGPLLPLGSRDGTQVVRLCGWNLSNCSVAVKRLDQGNSSKGKRLLVGFPTALEDLSLVFMVGSTQARHWSSS